MSIKKEYPILEFDSTEDAFINPKMIAENYPALPSHLVVCFFKDALDYLFENDEIVHLTTLKGENDCEIFKVVNQDVAIIPGKVGAPLCAGFLEECIALGAKHIMFCGGGGILKSDLDVGHLIIIDSAIRDEGTSYHYIAPSREINANPKVVKLISDFLDQEKIKYVIGKTWTTDAFYRETKKKIELRQQEGAILVEMEQSAMIAVSEFRKVNYGAIIYAGDDLSQEVWRSRGWIKREDIRKGLTRLAIRIVLTFDQLESKSESDS